MMGDADISTMMISVRHAPATDAVARPSALLAADAVPIEGRDDVRPACDLPGGAS